MVVALYIDPRGPYPALLGVERCWDETRDARAYDGPDAVVAHPPCSPWSRLDHLNQQRTGDCGPRAVEQVRKFGGVLEHPAHSKLFAACGLPRPGELPDAFGGRTIEVEQVRWGHVARKRTWLYLVGVRDLGELPPAREPTHWCSGSRKTPGSKNTKTGHDVPPGIKVASAQQRKRTPVQFAKWLIGLAEQATKGTT